jgi:hypothetical protein
MNLRISSSWVRKLEMGDKSPSLKNSFDKSYDFFFFFEKHRL